MCKRCGIREPVYQDALSVGYNGWFHVFFPSIQGRPNPLCVPYSPHNDYVLAGLSDFFQDVQADEEKEFWHETIPGGAIPSGVCSVPLKFHVDLDFNGPGLPQQLHGFVGFTQDSASKAVCPAVSWYLQMEMED